MNMETGNRYTLSTSPDTPLYFQSISVIESIGIVYNFLMDDGTVVPLNEAQLISGAVTLYVEAPVGEWAINITTTSQGFIVCITDTTEGARDVFVQNGTVPKIFAAVAGNEGALKAADLLTRNMGLPMIETVYLNGIPFSAASNIKRNVFED